MSDAQLARACDELAPHLLELSIHTFGNYVCQKLAAMAQAHDHLFCALSGHAVGLLKHPQGSRVLQAAISSFSLTNVQALVSELDGHVLDCGLDTHGSWGICAAFKRTHASFIVTQMAQHLPTLSTHQHGVRVVQQVVQEAGMHGMDISAVVNAVLSSDPVRLAAHSFGNYAVQSVLRHCPLGQHEALSSCLLPQLIVLSESKHGSNVAEVLLIQASRWQLDQVALTIFQHSSDGSSPMQHLMNSEFGNYVLQALLRLLDANTRSAAIQMIQAVSADSLFGQQILRAGEETQAIAV